MAANLQCPDCKLGLRVVGSGSVAAHRCPGCRGLWLDPGSFQSLCEEEARRAGETHALAVARGSSSPRAPPPREVRVRYRACPACGELMNRSHFARVSGVVIDVCRAHGAWFDRGELGEIRRFLREGGVRRYARNRRAESTRGPVAPAPPAGSGSLDVLYDLLVGGDGGINLPSRIPRLLVAAVFSALGGWLLRTAFHPHGYDFFGAAPVGIGLASLYFAWRALGQWAARRR